MGNRVPLGGTDLVLKAWRIYHYPPLAGIKRDIERMSKLQVANVCCGKNGGLF